jgi:hypothetical protein
MNFKQSFESYIKRKLELPDLYEPWPRLPFSVEHENIELDSTNSRNQFLKTKRAFKKGELVIDFEPQVLTINQNRISKNCAFCLASNPSFTCSGCNYYKYCDENCHSKDSLWHKYECGPDLSSYH